MNAKIYLRKIKQFEIRIEQKKFQLKGLAESYDYIKGIDYSRDKVQTSPRDTMAEQIIRVYGLREKITDEITAYEQTRDEIIRQIQSIDNLTFSDLLFKRYVEHKTFELIAVEMNYEYGSVRNMHGAALRYFSEAFADALEAADATETEQGKEV